MVGAVLVRDGEVVGEGYHAQVGGPHAEVEALRASGDRARGADCYVTLEPCCHHGRTPPCTDALLAAGVRRVVVGHRDPDPRVAGGGLEILRRAGVVVEVGLGAEAARQLNWKFLVERIHRRPAVTLKWAMSLDGRIATRSGDAKWISSPAARRFGLELREEHAAILVGIGTVLADDPRLDRRLGRASGPIVRVVLDRRLRTPTTAQLFGAPGPVLVVTESNDPVRRAALEAVGAEVVVLATVEPVAVLAELSARGLQSVLVEGGGGIHGAFLDSGLGDRIEAIVAPLVIGGVGATSPVAGLGPQRLVEALALEQVIVRRRGRDVVVGGFRAGCLQDLLSHAAG
jgi:diaminohydroxyphosphoribosylaminopyrimidine deaminase/5-amino-6-(5-phosphoribosylamino)uracil reductase